MASRRLTDTHNSITSLNGRWTGGTENNDSNRIDGTPPIWKLIPSSRLRLSPDKKTVPTVEYSPCYIKQPYTPGMEQQLDMNSRRSESQNWCRHFSWLRKCERMLIASGFALTCTHGGTANRKMWNRSHPLWYTIRTWSEGGSNG